MKRKVIKKILKFRYYYIGLFVVIVGLIGLGLFINDLSKSTQARIKPKLQKPTPQASVQSVVSYKLPILMYHYIREAPSGDQLGYNLSVTPQNFQTQMEWLYNDGYRTINAADVADPQKVAISKIYAESKKPVLITFDDGYDDAYTAAFPVLKFYQFKATFYVIRDYVGKPRYMNQQQIDEMVSAGMEIGSHTLSHVDLNKTSLSEAHRQIFDSKQQAQSFCYPSGQFNPIVETLVKSAGYLDATTTHEGIATEKSNLFELPRVRMTNDMTYEKFLQDVEGKIASN